MSQTAQTSLFSSDAEAAPVAGKRMADCIRALAMDAVQKANSGHPGMPMGMADVATVLFTKFMKFDPTAPKWADRDRFILSAGHGSMLIYSLLHLTGYEDMTLEELKNFRQWGAKTAGHPEYGHATGIETTTGPLGQGIANSVGFALAEEMLAARYGADVVDHYTYAIAGDGCLMEGISQEAISLAGHMKLNKLIVLWDDNKISIDGPISLSSSEDMPKRFEAAGWDVQEIDGHDHDAIEKAIAAAKTTDTPSMIACKTTIAFGAPTKSGSSASHGAPLGDDEIAGTRAALGWEHAPFEIPQDVLNAWREVGKAGKAKRTAWEATLEQSGKKVAFTKAMDGNLGDEWKGELQKLKNTFIADKCGDATRKSSGTVLNTLAKSIDALVGGSADLTGSNLTKAGGQTPVSADDYSGNYIYWGIREHGMASAMNGMALHGGVVPYAGTFLVFTDYCRPAIRLAALMGQRVIYVMTHDSIGLGEDGPTHQPVEHMASLRVIPNLQSFRPADAVEVAEAWELALESDDKPSLLALTRQGVPLLREDASENLSAKGAYVIREAGAEFKATIFATGSEVHLAVQARDVLEAQGIGVRVVSVPCAERFFEQDKDYVMNLVCNDSKKVAIEAASRMGWERFVGAHGTFIGMDGFGASAPANELYEHFGITSDALVSAIKQKLEG